MRTKRMLLMLMGAVLIVTSNITLAGEPNEPNAPAPNLSLSSQSITAWLNIGTTEKDKTDLGLWLGYRRKASSKFDVEAGLAGNYQSRVTEDGSTEHSTGIGLYGVLHTTGFLDVNMPLEWEGPPVKLIGEPFVSAEYLHDTNGEGQSFGLGTGARIFDIAAFKIQYNFIEGVPVKDHAVLSLSLRFKF